jgi:hypothetical protein
MKQFKGLLLKKIDLRDAPARGLREALALPPDENDVSAYVQQEEATRWAAFDETFGLDTSAPDIAVQRAMALIEYDTGVSSDDSLWVEHVSMAFARRHIPGFARASAGSNRHGAPVEWTDQQQAELIADVEYLRRKTEKSVKEICETLPRQKGYAQRWGRYSGEALRKAYTKARKASGGLLFQLKYFDAAATIPTNSVDPIDAAITRHALKI